MKSRCLVCESKQAIYKCPTCYLPFCSVACGKSHKKTSCQRENDSQKRPSPDHEASHDPRGNGNEPLGDGYVLAPDLLRTLDEHDEIQRKMRDERLVAILERIDRASNRAKALEKEMRNPEFLEFCDDVLEALQMKEPAEQP